MRDKKQKEPITKMEVKQKFISEFKLRKKSRGILHQKTLEDALDFAFSENNKKNWF